jgi:GT2 family glycosyltransferase
MLSYVLPTRNRLDRLRTTLEAIALIDAREHERCGGMEVLVVDNASENRLEIDASLASRVRLRIIELQQNIGAAARNVGVRHAQASGAEDWIVMLDDDSHPMDCRHIDVLLNAPANVAAIGADIFLPDGSRERGGLPEVVIGCGCAIRREAFLEVGGYDAAFDYYAEEYDLCAKLILAGWRILQDDRFRVLHEKTQAGRDFNVIVHRLVRNNAWVMQRYSPAASRRQEVARTIERYAGIAMNEHAACGFATGMRDLLESVEHQPRRPMTPAQWDRFTGASAARNALGNFAPGTRIAIVEEGKNVEVIRGEIAAAGGRIVADPADADAVVIGTLSPGPMRDAWKRWGGRATMCA